MIIIKISNKKYKYCTKQSEISWRVATLINDTLEEYINDKESIEFQKWCLSFLSNTTYDIIDQVSNDQVKFLISNHPYFAPNILNKFRKYLKINHKLYEYRDLDLFMSVLEYSELDNYANDKDFLPIIKRLYLPIHCTPKHWLKYLIIKNTKNFEDNNYFELQLALFYYFNWKLKLIQEYNLLMFNEKMGKEQQPDIVKLTQAELFGMYHIVMSICDNDYDKFMAWQSRDIRALFKFIMYSKIKSNK